MKNIILTLLLSFIPMSASAQGAQDKLFEATLITAITAHGADLASTEFCLGAGRCTELNPWLARYDNPAIFGAAKMGVAGLSLYTTKKLKDAGHPKWAIAANIGQTVGFGYIAYRNSQQGRK